MREGKKKVPKRIAQTVIGSLKGGVVPRIGLPYITVGRKSEIEALLHDVDIIQEGGASFRFIVGRYGSGKSFLIQTIRNYVMDRGFVVADAINEALYDEIGDSVLICDGEDMELVEDYREDLEFILGGI